MDVLWRCFLIDSNFFFIRFKDKSVFLVFIKPYINWKYNSLVRKPVYQAGSQVLDGFQAPVDAILLSCLFVA